jgi:thiamine-monophosphate kinase
VRRKAVSEEEIIRTLQKEFPSRIGYDASIVKVRGGRFAVSQDMSVEGTHFPKSVLPWYFIAQRSARASLSDLAACGAKPLSILVSLGVPMISKKELNEFIEGIKDFCKEFGVEIIGGDTTRSEAITINVTVIGDASAGYITRKGAKAGDSVFVTGTLGDSMVGLKILMDTGDFKKARRNSEYLVGRFALPEPRVWISSELLKRRIISSCTDLSDGLRRGLENLSEMSGVGFRIDFESIPVSDEFLRLAGRFFNDPLSAAFEGGEDFELLFTSPFKNRVIKLAQKFGLRITKIGSVIEGKGVKFSGETPKKLTFFEHFVNYL